MQIRSKLTLQFFLIVAAIMLFAFVYIYGQFKNRLQDEFYESLKSKAFLTGEMLVGKIKTAGEEPFQSKSDENNPLSSENISIYNRQNKLIYSFSNSKNITSFDLNQIKQSKERRFVNDKFNSIGVLFKNKYGVEYVIIAESVFNANQLKYLSKILIWIYLASIILIAIGGWLFSVQALRPVSMVINEVDSILPSDMKHRLNQSHQNDEISRLVLTFNKLLDRIQQAFDNQRLFLSNISHELKNPLNAITSQVEVALNKERNEAEYKTVLSSIYEDVSELNDVSIKLMQLSKINSDGSSVKYEPYRIDELLYQIKAQALKIHPQAQINLNLNSLPENEVKLTFMGNEQLLKNAILNIVDNAIKYSHNKPLNISLSFDTNNAAIIQIQDSGIGMSESEIRMMFEPFYRAQKTVSFKGSGIGLSLVKSIFDLHQIKFKVNSKLDQGTEFIITIENNLK